MDIYNKISETIKDCSDTF